MAENKTQPSNDLDPNTWVDRYGDYLYRFALSRIKDPGLAEELVQETFLAGLRSKKNFQGRSSVRTWLIAILKHKIIDHLRKKKPEDSREDMETFSDTVDQVFNEKGSWKDRPHRWSTNPMQVYEQREFMEVFYRCLSGLPKRLAKVFVMREMEGLGTDDICKNMTITPTNCWVILYRARMHLRRCLEQNWITQ